MITMCLLFIVAAAFVDALGALLTLLVLATPVLAFIFLLSTR
jgi:hypothetical protein